MWRTCTCGWDCTNASRRAETAEALDELNAEIYDRFGPLPPVAQNLLKLAKLKLAARALGIRRLDLGASGGTVTFEERNSLDPATVVKHDSEGSARIPARRLAETAGCAAIADRGGAYSSSPAELRKRLSRGEAPSGPHDL